ncbi:MAG: hypothetical protein Q7S09_02300 [bacterium]|nr:hypothetical protein [bacterium]
MGFHVCEYCTAETQAKNRFQRNSSGDVNLTFANGHRWVMPDMILHYVADHGWKAPAEFVDDVMNGEFTKSGHVQTRSMSLSDILTGTRVGYLTGPFEIGSVPDGFTEKLEKLMQQAGAAGLRLQTKEAPVYRG